MIALAIYALLTPLRLGIDTYHAAECATRAALEVECDRTVAQRYEGCWRTRWAWEATP